MAANGELAREGGGGRADQGKEEDVDDEATFFSLELALITGRQSSSIDGRDVEEKGKEEDGNEGIDGRQVAVAAAGDAASVAVGMEVVLGPAARLRALVRKLLKPKSSRPAARRHPSGGRAPAAVEERSRPFMASRAEVQPPVVVTAEERRTSTEAALKYLSNKVPILACRRGVVAWTIDDGPDDDTSPPPPPQHRPHQAPAAVLLPGRKSRGGAGPQACKRHLGTARSSVSVAALPPPTPPRRDDSLLQAQDGVASAIAYCKRSLTG
jgi:hypothetical protein